MEGFIIAGVLVGWFAVLMFLFLHGAYGDSIGSLILAFFWLIGGLGFLVNLTLEQSKEGPCLQWETGMSYNPATKTMMPYKRCSSRGEWLNGEDKS